MTANPYDRKDTCRCGAWSPGECGCGGYVDHGRVRAWQEGYEAGAAEVRARVTAALDAVDDQDGLEGVWEALAPNGGE